MQAGSRVVWRYRPSGGYGFVVPVAGIVRAVAGSMATIDVARRVAGQWRIEQRRVKLCSLADRTKYVAEIDAAENEQEAGNGHL